MHLEAFNLAPLPTVYGTDADDAVASARSLHARYILRRDLDERSEMANLPAAPHPHASKPDLKVGIIGAGVAGLYAAMILDSFGPQSGIEYEILEASDRVGGRLYTHKFPGGGPNDYYDVGAMRFPNIPFMHRTFDLFKRLALDPIKYVMRRDNNIKFFNGIKLTNKQLDDAHEKKHHDPFCTHIAGLHNSPTALISAQLGDFKAQLVEDFSRGWDTLMQYDTHSARGYMIHKGTAGVTYSDDVVSYLETFDLGTGMYDQALTEVVLDSLTFDYADPQKPHQDVEWHCIQGGTERVAKEMLTCVRGPVHKNKRVTAIALGLLRASSADDASNAGQIANSVHLNVVGEADPRTYDHVVSTVPFGCLRAIDTSQCGFKWQLSAAIRALQYEDSTKVGIRFSRRWWEDPGIDQRGGLSSTDRPTRVVVYPSYGIDGAGGPGASIIVSYTWSQDASRFGALLRGKTSDAEKHLIDVILSDLAAMHGKDKKELAELVLDYHAFDFYHNENSAGAFAMFGPGQFANLYREVTRPHGGVLHFAGEATSVHHAWIVGALNSAYRSVLEILSLCERKDLIAKMQEEWGPNDEFELGTVDLQVKLGRANVP